MRDFKIKFGVETVGTSEMMLFAKSCGYSLALSHARPGKAAVMSGYLGNNDNFDLAIARLSTADADQNEKDHAALKRAIREVKVKAVVEQTR